MAQYFQCPHSSCQERPRVYAHKNSYNAHFKRHHGPEVTDAIIVHEQPKKVGKKRRKEKKNTQVSSNIPSAEGTLQLVDPPAYENLPVMNNVMLRDEETWRKRLEGIDKTPDGRFDAYSVIQTTLGVTRKIARQIWERINLAHYTSVKQCKIPRFQFLDSRGRKKASIPVLTLSQILGLMPHLPGKVGKQMNQAAVNLGLRTAAGDADVRAASVIQEQRLSSEMKNSMMTGLASSQAAIEQRNTTNKSYPVLSDLEAKLRQKELEYMLENFELLKKAELDQKKSDMRYKRKCQELDYDKFKMEREDKRQKRSMEHKKLDMEEMKLKDKLAMERNKFDLEKTKQNKKFDLEKTKQKERLDMEKTKQNEKIEMERTKQNEKFDIEKKKQDMEKKRLEMEFKERELKMKLATKKQEIDKQKIENETCKIENAKKKMDLAEMKEIAEVLKRDGYWSCIDQLSYNCKIKNMCDLPSETTVMKIVKLVYSHLGGQVPINQAKRIAAHVERCYLIHRNGDPPIEEEHIYLEKVTKQACMTILKSWIKGC
jgi:hypothetical protein